jgi:hypothetical protein
MINVTQTRPTLMTTLRSKTFGVRILFIERPL